MRLQHAAIFFIIIFIPIFMVISYFIQQQVDTLALQNTYDAKLLDATHDAMLALELNTANEDLSTVSDSLRGMVEASTNIFFNTLATNLGISNASKSFVQPYIPAILYTLYDGFYLYTPTSSPEVCVDKFGQTISTNSKGVSYVGSQNINGRTIGFYNFNPNNVNYETGTTTPSDSNPTVNYDSLSDQIKEEYGQLLYKNKDGTYSAVLHTGGGTAATYYKQSYILKSFISYSARYVRSNIDVTVNYTLDNFLSIEGKIDNAYYTKSGYLIADNLVKRVTLDGTLVSWKKISEEAWHEYINSSDHTATVELNDGTIISTTDPNGGKSAVEYYVDAWIFSKWVYENLKDIEEQDIVNNEYNILNLQTGADQTLAIDSKYNDMIYKFTGRTNKIFDPDVDPENLDEIFYDHKRNVIKNSITYNLVLSMITYTEMSRTIEYSMPMLTELEWDTVLSNISIVSFMQGMKCGLKYYNNYAIVSSTNNEMTVTPSEIYYVPDNGGTDLTDNDVIETAHRLDCPHLAGAASYISFKSKEIKYDKIYSKADQLYLYDHKAYLDYNCIVDSNYGFEGYINDTIAIQSRLLGNGDILQYLLNNKKDNVSGNIDGTIVQKLKAYRIAIAKEKNNLYKSIEFEEKFGYQIQNTTTKITAGGSITLSLGTKKVSDVAKIEVVISNAHNTSGGGVYTDTVSASLNGTPFDNTQTFPVTTSATRTLSFEGDFDSDTSANSLLLNVANGSTITVKSVKIYYK